MRIDKYLKVSRLVKRRTVAKVLADKDQFYINGRLAKPSSDVKVGDTIELHLGSHHIVCEVLAILNSTKIADAQSMYRIIKDEVIKENK